MTEQLDLLAPSRWPRRRRSEREQAELAVQRLSQGQRRELIRWLREQLRELYHARVRHDGLERAAVHADDARRILSVSGRDPGGPHHWIAAVFQGKEFQAIPERWHFSETEGSHGNRLRCYRCRS